jgi:hypothetical protein
MSDGDVHRATLIFLAASTTRVVSVADLRMLLANLYDPAQGRRWDSSDIGADGTGS